MAGFFDKVVVGINEGYNTAKEGSKLLIEKTKISTQIKEAERDKNVLFQNLGMLTYNLYMNGQIELEQCSGICDEVSVIENKISDLQKQLQQLEMPKAQPMQYTQTTSNRSVDVENIACECGYINSGKAKFCAKCGKALDNTANE